VRSIELETRFLLEAARRGLAPAGWLRDVRHRLTVGEAEYGDRSYGYEPPALIMELSQEVLDIPAWASILAHSQQPLNRKHWRNPVEARDLTVDIAAATGGLYRQIDRLTDLLVLP